MIFFLLFFLGSFIGGDGEDRRARRMNDKFPFLPVASGNSETGGEPGQSG